MHSIFNLPTPESTRNAGQNIALNFNPGDIIDLEGPMGSGKTTLANSIAISLGANPQEVHSPSYTIIHCYHLSSNQKIKKIYHIDAWRIRHDSDIDSTGLEEILTDLESIFIIEWSKNIKQFLPEPRWRVQFETTADGGRKIYLSSPIS